MDAGTIQNFSGTWGVYLGDALTTKNGPGGEVVLDSDGKPVMVPQTDEEGNPLCYGFFFAPTSLLRKDLIADPNAPAPAPAPTPTDVAALQAELGAAKQREADLQAQLDAANAAELAEDTPPPPPV